MHLVKIYKKKQKKNCETKAAFGHSCSNVHFSSFSTPLLYKCQGDMSRRLFLPPQTHQFLLVFYSHPLHFYYYVVNCFPPGGAQECGPIGCWHCSCNGTYYGKYYTCLILSKHLFQPPYTKRSRWQEHATTRAKDQHEWPLCSTWFTVAVMFSFLKLRVGDIGYIN